MNAMIKINIKVTWFSDFLYIVSFKQFGKGKFFLINDYCAIHRGATPIVKLVSFMSLKSTRQRPLSEDPKASGKNDKNGGGAHLRIKVILILCTDEHRPHFCHFYPRPLGLQTEASVGCFLVIMKTYKFDNRCRSSVNCVVIIIYFACADCLRM